VWEWYHWRRARIAQCYPNPAHDVIAGWSARDGSCVLTQNVDDLHMRAGTRRLVRLHGSIWELRCWDDCGQPVWRDEQFWPGDTGHSRGTATDDVHHCPRCPRCEGLARPAVVWFGESLNRADVETALAACDCDLFLTIGTSSIVHPAAGFVHEAARRGAFTVEINPDQTPASDLVDLVIRAAAEDILPALASA